MAQTLFFALGTIVLVITGLSLAADILIPVSLAVLIWFLINALATWLRSIPWVGRHLRAGQAVVLSLILTLSAAGWVIGLVVANLGEISDRMAQAGPQLQVLLRSAEAYVGLEQEINVEELFDDLRLETLVGRIASAIGDIAGQTGTILLYVIFLLLDQPYYKAKLRALFPRPERRSTANEVLAKINADVRTYIGLMTVASLIVGVVTYAVLVFYNIDAAAFWGFLAFLLNYIPTIGTFLGIALPFLYALVQFGADAATTSGADLVVIFVLLTAIQMLVGNVLVPRWMGDRLNLSQFVVILSLIVWGAMWGATGMFLGVPLTMIAVIILARFEQTKWLAILLSLRGSIDQSAANDQPDGAQAEGNRSDATPEAGNQTAPPTDVPSTGPVVVTKAGDQRA